MVRPRNLLSGLFRSLRSRLIDGTLTAREVKGHCNPDTLSQCSQAWYDAVGNCAADRYANLGTELGALDPDTTALARKLAGIADAAT